MFALPRRKTPFSTVSFENNGLTPYRRYTQVEVATFVKHPDTNEMLPAEASGRIRPGDELVDINGHSVEGLNAEEAMSLIRHVRPHTLQLESCFDVGREYIWFDPCTRVVSINRSVRRSPRFKF